MSNKINESTQKKVFNDWLKTQNKAETARKYDISPRSVGRIVKRYSNDNEPTQDLINLMNGDYDNVCGGQDAPNIGGMKIETKKTIPDNTTIINWTGGLKFISLVLSNGETITINSDDERYKGVKEALWNEDIDKALEIADKSIEIKKWSKNGVEISQGQLSVHGTRMSGAVVDHIIQSFETGRDFDKYVNFYIKLLQNNDTDSVRQLLPFMKHNDIDVDKDGNIIAWKMVTTDYKDHHTGKIDNSVGAEPWMPREDVVDDPKRTCSSGLHVCAKAYIGFFSNSRIVKVLIDPANVVSVPNDYNGAKMRVCRYKVIEDVTETFTK